MKYRLAEDYLWKEVNDRIVVLHFDSGKYYTLNATGSLIWKGIMNGLSQAEILDQMCEEYDIDRQTAADDTEKIINDFESKHFLIKL